MASNYLRSAMISVIRLFFSSFNLQIVFFKSFNIASYYCISQLTIIIYIIIKFQMGFYSYVSLLLTIFGQAMMTYRTVFLLNDKSQKKKHLQSLGIKWMIFLLFLNFEGTLASIFEIIPFGMIFLLAVKCILILPQNALAVLIYQKLQKQLEKIQFQQYSSQFGEKFSKAVKFVVLKLLKLIQKLVIYINSQQIHEVEALILQTIKTVEYKKTAVNIKGDVHKSGQRKQLQQNSELNQSVDSIDIDNVPVRVEVDRNSKKNEIGQRISRIIYDDEQVHETFKIKIKQMIRKPNKQRNQSAIYQDVSVEFFAKNLEIVFIDKNKSKQKDKLIQIKYVSKNMMTLELILQKYPSKIIKLIKTEDLITWMKPIVQILRSR